MDHKSQAHGNLLDVESHNTLIHQLSGRESREDSTIQLYQSNEDHGRFDDLVAFKHGSEKLRVHEARAMIEAVMPDEPTTTFPERFAAELTNRFKDPYQYLK